MVEVDIWCTTVNKEAYVYIYKINYYVHEGQCN